MSVNYSEETVRKAEQELARRRSIAESEQLEREERISRELPEAAELKRSLRNGYFELVKLIAAHEGDAKEAAERIRAKSISTQERLERLLAEHTGDPHYLDVRYSCPACRDTGFVEGVRCNCMKDLLKRFAAEEMNENSAIALHDFSEYRPTYYPEGDIRRRMDGVCAYLRKYCADFPIGSCSLLFAGGTGLGKTFLSSCIARALGERGISAAFVSAFDMLRTLENEHFGRAQGNTMDQLLTVDMLIIDDLGSEPNSSVYETFLYNIINGRINRRLPTVISTNLEGEVLRSRYHDRLASRIMSEFRCIIFRGEDIRQIKALEKRR